MDVWIQWTGANEAHIARHGVAPQEVEEAVESPYWTFPGREDSTILLGRTYAGRHLTVVLAESAENHRSWYAVTARDMTPKERTGRSNGRCDDHGRQTARRTGRVLRRTGHQ